MNLDKCNHHSSHNIEHCHHRKKMPSCFFQICSSLPQILLLATDNLTSITVDCLFQNFIWNHYSMYSFVWSIKHNASEIHPHCVHQAFSGRVCGALVLHISVPLPLPSCLCLPASSSGWLSLFLLTEYSLVSGSHFPVNFSYLYNFFDQCSSWYF